MELDCFKRLQREMLGSYMKNDCIFICPMSYNFDFMSLEEEASSISGQMKIIYCLYSYVYTVSMRMWSTASRLLPLLIGKAKNKHQNIFHI